MKAVKDRSGKTANDLMINFVSAGLGFALSFLYDFIWGDYKGNPNIVLVVIVSVALGLTLAVLIMIRNQMKDLVLGQRKLLRATEKSHDDLIKKFGVNIKLLTYGPGSDYQNTFQMPTKLLHNAKSIIALDYHGETVRYDTKLEQAYIDWYELLNTVINENPEIEYRRILQLKKGATDSLKAANHFDPVVIKHYQQIMQVNQTNKHVRLQTCPIFLSRTCFIIIDKKYIFWELPVINNDSDFHFDMDMMIEDPDGNMVQELIDQINLRIEHTASIVTSIQ